VTGYDQCHHRDQCRLTSLKFAAYAVDASGSPPALPRQIDGMQDDPHFIAKNPGSKPLERA